MASVNIPFNLDAKQNGEQDQNLNQRALTSFYAYQDPGSGLMPQTLITNERESEEICFKRFLPLGVNNSIFFPFPVFVTI
jgi:hypothetical protein